MKELRIGYACFSLLFMTCIGVTTVIGQDTLCYEAGYYTVAKIRRGVIIITVGKSEIIRNYHRRGTRVTEKRRELDCPTVILMVQSTKWNGSKWIAHGIRINRFPNGHLKSMLSFRNGRRHGKFRSGWPNGNPREWGHYKKGVEVGTWKEFNSQGELIYKGPRREYEVLPMIDLDSLLQQNR